MGITRGALPPALSFSLSLPPDCKFIVAWPRVFCSLIPQRERANETARPPATLLTLLPEAGSPQAGGHRGGRGVMAILWRTFLAASCASNGRKFTHLKSLHHFLRSPCTAFPSPRRRRGCSHVALVLPQATPHCATMPVGRSLLGRWMLREKLPQSLL